MYEVNFSEQSIKELNLLSKPDQIEIINALSLITSDELKKNSEEIGHFVRNGNTFYRLRIGELRVYFEIKASNNIYCNYILHQHTLTDFIFRFKLPISESQLAEQHDSFWKYIETLNR